MPRKLIKRYLPTPDKLRAQKALGVFGEVIFAPNLWHLNKKSFSGAFSLGLFSAFIPIPFQMLVAAAGALIFRVNLPISVILVWITNPVTMAPIFYFCYLVGAYILNTPVQTMEFALSVEWLQTELSRIWQPFLLGCFMVGTLSAVAGNISARLLWRYLVVKNWLHRKHLRRRRENIKKNENCP